jgi:hypothetical protein
MCQTSLPCFDDLMLLAQQHPDQLESLREQLTREVLDSAPDAGMRSRLEQLVFRINAERQRHRSPMALCLKFSSLMHDKLLNMRSELQKLTTDAETHTPQPPATKQSRVGSSKVIYLDQYR